MSTDPEEFKRFHELLVKDAPKGFQPFYFPLEKNGKDPWKGNSWKNNRKTFQEACKLMQGGFNIGIAATEKDPLVIVDIDDLDQVKDPKPTLMNQSRKRIGRHCFYFTDEKPAKSIFENSAKQNIATEDAGEVRSVWQYVVAAGSYVPCAPEELERIPEDDRPNAGKYSVMVEHSVTKICYTELPEAYRSCLENKRAIDITNRQKKAKRPTGLERESKNRSALWDLDIHDVSGHQDNPTKRFPSPFHGSNTYKDTSVSNGMMHCWRHNVSHSALTYLAVEAGISNCSGAGFGHNGAGGSDVDFDDPETVYKVWLHAKNRGYIPDDDPMPTKAMVHSAIQAHLCDAREIVDGWKLPRDVYNDIIEHAPFNVGREPLPLPVEYKEKRREADAEYKGQTNEKNQYGVPIEYDGLYELHFAKSGEVKNIVFYYEEMADKIQEDLCALSFKDRVYAYEDGVYREGEDRVKSEIARIFKGIKAAKRGFRASVKSADSEILYYIKYNEPCLEWPFNNHDGMIPVNNGILKLNFAAGKVELVPHSPEYKFNYKIPIDYDPSADREPIDSVLRSYVDEEDVDELYQIPAQALLQASGHAPFKKCYLLQGRPDAGKSTYLELLYRTFGNENKSDISLEDLNPSVHRYKTAGLVGKLFNIHDDLQSFPMKDTGPLKKLTGAYSHDVEIKGVQPFQAELKAVYMFACNDPPKIKNNDVKKDEAFWSRWEYVRFPNHFEKDTTFYDRMFTPENLSGFLRSVVEAALKIGKENKLLCESNYYEVRDTWAKCSEPVYQFITENMERSQAGRLMYFDKDEMFRLIQEWGEYKQLDADDLPPSKERLTQVLEICGVNASKPTSKRTGTQVPAYAFPYKWRAESIWEGKINQIELQREQARFK